jgi:hypothetical protein
MYAVFVDDCPVVKAEISRVKKNTTLSALQVHALQQIITAGTT